MVVTIFSIQIRSLPLLLFDVTVSFVVVLFVICKKRCSVAVVAVCHSKNRRLETTDVDIFVAFVVVSVGGMVISISIGVVKLSL
jgi:hypothetical protein